MKSGRGLPAASTLRWQPLRLQLWLWFIGMMVMTLPWHWLGLQGQWRRVANFNYDNPIIAGWGPLVLVSVGGGLVLLVSALLVPAQSRRAAPRSSGGCTAASLRARGASAAASARRAERLRPVERTGPRSDAARLRLSVGAVCHRSVAERDGSSDPIDTEPWPILLIHAFSTGPGAAGRVSPSLPLC